MIDTTDWEEDDKDELDDYYDSEGTNVPEEFDFSSN